MFKSKNKIKLPFIEINGVPSIDIDTFIVDLI